MEITKIFAVLFYLLIVISGNCLADDTDIKVQKLTIITKDGKAYNKVECTISPEENLIHAKTDTGTVTFGPNNIKEVYSFYGNDITKKIFKTKQELERAGRKLWNGGIYIGIVEDQLSANRNIDITDDKSGYEIGAFFALSKPLDIVFELSRAGIDYNPEIASKFSYWKYGVYLRYHPFSPAKIKFGIPIFTVETGFGIARYRTYLKNGDEKPAGSNDVPFLKAGLGTTLYLTKEIGIDLGINLDYIISFNEFFYEKIRILGFSLGFVFNM
jgi:hypothetical protein